MDPLLPWIVANGATLLLLASVLAYLHAMTRDPALRWWALGFGCGALGQVACGLDGMFGPRLVLTLVSTLLAVLTAGAYLLASATATARRVRPRLWGVAGLLVAGWTTLAFLSGLQRPLLIAPLIGAMMFSMSVSGTWLLQARPSTASTWMAGGGQIALGLHAADYVVVSAHPALLSWGYLVAILLNITVAVGLIMAHFETAHEALVQREKELADARRMEVVGRLAGGVAHDFNNLLTVISGNLSLAVYENKEPLIDEYLSDVQAATSQAGRLTAQLLALGRRSVLHPEPLELQSAVAQTVGMLRRVVPENIELRARGLAQPAWVRMDRASLEQLIVNLVANARDAMPGGGILSVQVQLEPDGSLVIEIEDDGEGMDPSTLDRVFEPFFTTKELGRGTGLGLATVQGIVLQMGGTIDVASRPREGTTVTVRLSVEAATPPQAPAPQRAVGRLRVLVVEDERAVQRLAEQAMREAGHEVHASTTGLEALERFGAGERFDLVISDVVMPGLGGIQLAHKLALVAPEAAILLVSGYPLEGGELPEHVAYLPKPYTPAQLREAAQHAVQRR